MLLSRILKTNWWRHFVDGTNPEDHGRVLVSQFFRNNQIDPYLLEHAMINDYKRWLLLEVHGKKGKETEKSIKLGMDRLAEIKRFQLADLRRTCLLKQELSPIEATNSP